MCIHNIPLDNSRYNGYYSDMARLAEELKMTKPFSLQEEEASLSIMRTADLLQQRALEVIKPFDLSAAQYNVLRILRGAKGAISCSQIAERMVSKDPDITRLLDRMENRGLVMRERDTCDRRVVKVRISAAGLKLVERSDPSIEAFHQKIFSAFGERKLTQFIGLMEDIRQALESETGEET